MQEVQPAGVTVQKSAYRELSSGGLWAPAGRAWYLKKVHRGEGMHGGDGPGGARALCMGAADYALTARCAAYIPPTGSGLQQKSSIIVSCAAADAANDALPCCSCMPAHQHAHVV